MQNRTSSVDILHIPDVPPVNFPISFPSEDSYSPSTEPIVHIHFHDCFEVGYCFEGGGIFFVDGKIIPFSSRDVSIIFKNQLHIAQSDSSNISKWKFISILPELLLAELHIEELNNVFSILDNTRNFPNILEYSLYPKISELVFRLIEELHNKKPSFKSYIKSLVWQLFIEMERISPKVDNSDVYLKNNIQPLAPAFEYISNNYMKHLEVETLALLCHTTDRNLRRLFAKAIKLSPQEYIIKFRIQMAASLLRTTNNSIVNISSAVGFASLSSFNRQFKSLMGSCPKEWRAI